MTNNGTRFADDSLSQIRVLVLGGESDRLSAAGSALEQHGLSVALETSVSAGLESVETGGVECVVVPEQFAERDGYGVAQEIRALDEHLPIIMLVETQSEDGLDDLADSVVTDYVFGDINSISFGRLTNRIRAAVAAHRSFRARESGERVVESLEREISATKQKITALHKVAMSLNDARSEDAVYRETVSAAEDILKLDICFVFAAEETEFVPRASSSRETELALEPVPKESGAMGKSHRTGESLRAVDMDHHPDAQPTFGDYKSGISVPIGDFAVFQAVSKQPGAFDRIDLELAELLATHATAALRRLEFEAALRVERDHYAVLFENTADCIVETRFVEGESVVQSVNPAFEDVFGFDSEDIVGEPLDSVIVPDEYADEAREITERARAGEFVRAEVTRQSADGTRKEFLLRSIHLDEETAFVVYTDISQRTAYQQELEYKTEQLEVLTRVLQHDIRNDIGIITGWAEELKATMGEEYAEPLTRIIDSSRHIDDLTYAAGTYVELIAGESMGLEPVELEGLLLQQVDNIRTLYEEARIVIEDEIPSVSVQANEMVSSAFSNLLTNAVRHNDADTPTVEIAVDTDPDVVSISIADNGPGIPDDRKESIFGEGEKGMESEGTGIGLFLTRRLLEECGGEITIQDNEPTGSVFTVTLRRASA